MKVEQFKNKEKYILLDDDELTIGSSGRMSYCMMATRLHFFILFEKGKYSGNDFKPTGKSFCFSYVPKSVVNVINKNTVKNSLKRIIDYFPFMFTEASLIESFELGNSSYVRLFDKPVDNWLFEPYDGFKFYNVMSILPYFGITDCIGYNNYYYFGITPVKSYLIYIVVLIVFCLTIFKWCLLDK